MSAAAPAPPRKRAAPARAGGQAAPVSPGERLGLRSDWDFALHLPLHYVDETRITPIAELREGRVAVVQARVVQAELMAARRRVLRVSVEDEGARLELRFFHFYPNWARQYAPGKELRIRGEPRRGLFGFEMVHPVCRVATPADALPQSLTPIYPAGAGISQAWLRKAVAAALRRLDAREWLPAELLERLRLPPIAQALQQLHAPPPELPLEQLEQRSHPAWRRVKFDELLAQQLAQQMARSRRAEQRAWPMPERGGGLVQRLLAALPFALTADQAACVAEIAVDLQREQPMHRLLQGDVGCGKTVVAALAAAQAIDNGFQCALMAPTDILAAQHLQRLAGWLQPLGVGVAWLSGAQRKREREAELARAASGEAALVIGTHAVIQDKVQFARLGLALVDEQHRFGVAQRLSLRAKGTGEQRQPHLLMMTATPIPRTLAMAVFGDLDISTIAHSPPGRQPVRTRVFSDQRREAVKQRVRELVLQGRQAYWVCPLIEPSEPSEGGEGAAQAGSGPRGGQPELRAALDAHAELQELLGAQADCVGLLHGRMPAALKAQVMADFAAGRLRLLVATTVIEVGVDVPSASLMVIEHAERFGLSQLHQLRGRVGRGSQAAQCLLLFSEPLSQTARARLQAMHETSDGFVLAQKDLELRGPGELLGQRQSGLQGLRHADLREDEDLLELAREAAASLLREHPQAAREHLQRWLGGGMDWLAA
ncbi:ATP-dependent DNA helicase RecG [Thiomonas sp. FB-6]|uniref:ATP-dependent DNA helicase RecG n=1 Tax=Thiomonas sp. FB-6 TaxID=1158291 RepID=UPI000372363C|nr:ATP-dependent DNA helicase RecG [Thiomonas sp. FB-6]